MISDAFISVIQDPVSKKKIGSANWHEGLYVLNCCPPIHSHVFPIAFTIPACNNSTSVSLNHIQFDSQEVPKLLWDYRLIHLSIPMMKILDGIPSNITINKDCH